MRVIRSSEYRRMRWKNGQGETAEIAISPSVATVDNFDWRISMARIEASGPFSRFPGVDRTLTVVTGSGLELAVAGRQPVTLFAGSAPYPFHGDSAAYATLHAGAVTDLNVMTQRTGYSHRVRRLTAAGTTALGASAAATVLACGDGVRLRIDGVPAELGVFDSVVAEPSAATLDILAAGEGGLILVEIGRA